MVKSLFLIFLLQMFTTLHANTILSDAFKNTFVIHDKSVINTDRSKIIQDFISFMKQQNISNEIYSLRNMSDIDLLSMAMKSALIGISYIKHDNYQPHLIVLNAKTGLPILEDHITHYETAIYVSIIIILATIITLQNIFKNS